MQKNLDVKIADIRKNPTGSKAFILADAKDADMALGLAATGPASPESHHHEFCNRSLEEYRQAIREVTAQGLVDIMLMSASTCEQMAIKERLFENSAVTPAARANDTTDIHLAMGSRYHESPSRPFRSATLDHIQCGKLECEPGEKSPGADLGLYSVTFNNDLERDLESLKAFKEFRLEAEAKGFRYFLEVFDPNIKGAIPPSLLGRFINDSIVRSLAGVTERGRPLFLKIPYHGPKAMEELVHYDPKLIPGILGGASGTTYDAFKLISEAQKHGARAALFGRKINLSEHQLAFVQFLRLIVDGEVSPEEAVRAYHGVLERLKIKPHRSLEDDSVLTVDIMGDGSGAAFSYASGSTAGRGAARANSKSSSSEAAPAGKSGGPAMSRSEAAHAQQIDIPLLPDGSPDFAKMTNEQRLAWGQRERDRVFG